MAATFVAPSSPVMEARVAGRVIVVGAASEPALLTLSEVQSPYCDAVERLQPSAPSVPPASAKPGQDGVFELFAPAWGFWRLRAQHPRSIPMELELAPLVEPLEAPEVKLEPDRGLMVLVVDSKGGPVADALVLVRGDLPPPAARDEAQWRPAPRLGRTDEHGRLRLPAAASERLVIEVVAVGYKPRRLLAGPGQLNVELRRADSASVWLRTPAGKPVPRALAFAGDLELPVSVSDESGRINLPVSGRERTSYRITAADGGFADLVVPAAIGQEPPSERRLVLQPPGILSGFVVDAERREPIAGAWIWLSRAHGFAVESDPQGRYRLPQSLTGETMLQVAAPGFLPQWVRFRARRDGDLEGPVFALRPASTLLGRVVDERGRSLAGVDLRARFDPSLVPFPSFEERSSKAEAKSRADGRFELRRLIPGVGYHIRAAKEGFAALEVSVAAPERGATTRPLRLVLHAGARLVGRVVTADQEPVSGAEVAVTPGRAADSLARLRQLRDPDPLLARRLVTDRGGRFEVRDLAPGRLDIAVAAAGLAEVTVRNIQVPEGREPLDLGTLVLQPEAPVHGLVTDPEGRPVMGVQVFLLPAEESAASLAELYPEDYRGPALATTDAQGRFSVGGRREGGRLSLVFTLDGFAPQTVRNLEAPTEEPVQVVLRPLLPLAGRVVNERREALAGLVVLCCKNRAASLAGMAAIVPSCLRETSDAEGRVRFEGVEAGALELLVSAPGLQALREKVNVGAEQSTREVELVLKAGATLSGQVRTREGVPVAGAEIGRPMPEIPGGFAIEAPFTTSDATGRYRAEGLEPGLQVIQASHPTLGRQVSEMDLAPGETTLDFELAGGARLEGVVVGPDEQPVPGAYVQLTTAQPTAASYSQPQLRQSGLSGEFVFEDVAVGRYRLRAQKPGAGRTAAAVTIEVAEGEPAIARLELRAFGVIRGRILGLAEPELSTVVLYLDSMSLAVGTVSPDGAYQIDDVLPGEHHLVARLSGTPRLAFGTAVLTSDADVADLDLEFAECFSLAGLVLDGDRLVPDAELTLYALAGEIAHLRTDTQGAFQADCLPAGDYAIDVRAADGRGVATINLHLMRDEHVFVRLPVIPPVASGDGESGEQLR